MYSKNYHISNILPPTNIRFAACCQRMPGVLCLCHGFKHVTTYCNSALKLSFYILSNVIFLCNLLSGVLQVALVKAKLQTNLSNGILVGFLNVTDVVLSLPLFMLWVTDLVFGDSFFLSEYLWRRSEVCHMILGLFVLFTLLSPASLSIFSYQRLQIVRNPIETEYKRTPFLVKRLSTIVAFVTILSTTLTCLTLVNVHLVDSPLPTSLCSPFVDPIGSLIAINVLLGLTIVWQFMCTVFISWNFYELIVSIHLSKQSTEHITSRKASNVILVVQVILISLSNILCWIPSASVFVASSVMETYPIEMILWTTILVVPINSVLNPVTFCFLSIRKLMKEKFKKRH